MALGVGDEQRALPAFVGKRHRRAGIDDQQEMFLKP